MSIIYGNVKPTFMEIYPDWKYITKTDPKKTILRAGTPLSANGRVANNYTALGLVAEDTGETDNPISIIVGGVVDEGKISTSYGGLSNSAKNALRNILFMQSNTAIWTPEVLPTHTSSARGKYLRVNENNDSLGWADAPGERFTVTLTPTALDFSGTMDKTVAEILEAFSQGRDVWFHVVAAGWQLNVRVGEANYADSYEYPSFNARTIIGPDITGSRAALLLAATGATNEGTDNTYFTELFTLTPLGS